MIKTFPDRSAALPKVITGMIPTDVILDRCEIYECTHCAEGKNYARKCDIIKSRARAKAIKRWHETKSHSGLKLRA